MEITKRFFVVTGNEFEVSLDYVINLKTLQDAEIEFQDLLKEGYDVVMIYEIKENKIEIIKEGFHI